MSGGPIFDVAGRLIGIHGRGDREIKENNTEASQESSVVVTGETGQEKTGFNLGIPIQTFLQLMPNATVALGINFDGSEPGGLLGGITYALRGGNSSRASDSPPTNIIEEEETTKDIVVGQPKKPQSSQPVAPRNSVSPKPDSPENTITKPNSDKPAGRRLF